MQITTSSWLDFTPVTVSILCQTREELATLHVLGNQSRQVVDAVKGLTQLELARLAHLLDGLYDCTHNELNKARRKT